MITLFVYYHKLSITHEWLKAILLTGGLGVDDDLLSLEPENSKSEGSPTVDLDLDDGKSFLFVFV